MRFDLVFKICDNCRPIPRFHGFGILRERMPVIAFSIFSQAPKSGKLVIVFGTLKQDSLPMFCHFAEVRGCVKAENTTQKE